MVHSHWYWWLQFKAELSILVSPFFMCVTPFLCSKKHVSHIFGMFTACSAPVCNARLYLVGQHSRGLCFPVCSFPALCPLPSFAGLPHPSPSPARLSLGCLVTVLLASWPQHSHIFPSLLLTPEFGAGFSRKKERKKEGRLCCSQTYFLTPSWRHIILCYSVPPKYCYVVSIPLHSSIKEFCSHFLSVG